MLFIYYTVPQMNCLEWIKAIWAKLPLTTDQDIMIDRRQKYLSKKTITISTGTAWSTQICHRYWPRLALHYFGYI